MAALTLNVNETIQVKDERRGASRCTISDLAVRTTAMTQAEFDLLLRNGSGVGYSNFGPFIAGDHEYADAIFKGVVETDGGSSPRIAELALTVDLPDVYDRGTATTSASAPVTVTCNRPYHVVSEVVATCKGGTVVAVPRVTNIQVVGTVATFDIELVNTAGARVVGEVSWASKGY